MGGEWSLLGEIFSGGGMSKVLARRDSPSKENPVDCCATP